MVLCDENECDTDFITYDDIENNEHCISFNKKGEIKCTTCETIKHFLSADPGKNEINVKKLFDIEDKEDADQIWEKILRKCEGIIRPLPEPENLEEELYIAEPNYEGVYEKERIILERIGDESSNSYKFIKTLVKILKKLKDKMKTLKEFPKIQEKKSFIYRNFKQVLFDEVCSSQMIHNIQDIPLNIELFLDQLANSNEENFQKVVQFINTKPQLCLEGVIELSRELLGEGQLMSETFGGKKRKTKRRKTKNKKNKKRKTKKTKKRNK